MRSTATGFLSLPQPVYERSFMHSIELTSTYRQSERSSTRLWLGLITRAAAFKGNGDSRASFDYCGSSLPPFLIDEIRY